MPPRTSSASQAVESSAEPIRRSSKRLAARAKTERLTGPALRSPVLRRKHDVRGPSSSKKKPVAQTAKTKKEPTLKKKKNTRQHQNSAGAIVKPPAAALRAVSSKSTANNRSKAKTAPTSLSEKALRQLEAETGSTNPRKDLGKGISEETSDSMTKSETSAKTKRTTLYSSKMVDELTRRGILEQQYPPEKPKNYEEIRQAILKPRQSPPPSEDEYIEYSKEVRDANNESAIAMVPFTSFFGLNSVHHLKAGHKKESNQLWIDHQHILGDADSVDVDVKIAPKPDYAEGLAVPKIPRWICKDLGGIGVPSARLAFPNFIAELKRDGSMFVGHTEIRHYGSVGAQAYHQYYAQIQKDLEESWNTARVGSVQFNGLVVEGNVHWVSKCNGDGTKPENRKYHMTRIMGHFTSGLSFEVFQVARREARNFRDYFQTVREKHLQDFQLKPRRPVAPIDPQAAPSPPDPNTQSTHGGTSQSTASSVHERKKPRQQKSPRGRGRPKRKSGNVNAPQATKRNRTDLSFQVDTIELGT